jgi:hypothetical protein
MGVVPLGIQPLPPHAVGVVEVLGFSPMAMVIAWGPTTPKALVEDSTEFVVEFVGKSQPIRMSWAWEEFPRQPRMAKQYAKTHSFGEVKTFINLILA